MTFYRLEMNFAIFSISEILVGYSQLDFRKGKQKVKMLRFSPEACEIDQWLVATVFGTL